MVVAAEFAIEDSPMELSYALHYWRDVARNADQLLALQAVK